MFKEAYWTQTHYLALSRPKGQNLVSGGESRFTSFVVVGGSYFILVMTSTSASQQPSGSSAAAPIYTTTVPLAKPPDPLNLEDRSRRGDNWLHFKRAWQIYERAAGISHKCFM